MKKMEIAEFVRFSDQGFDCKAEKNEKFYNILIEKIDEDYEYDEKIFNSALASKVKGCFAYTYKYNHSAIDNNGVLSHRYRQKKNFIYMPLDEIVYVRNVKSDHDTSLITTILCETTLNTKVARSVKKHIFLQMKLSSLLERIECSYKTCGYANEIITEVFLLEEQVHKYKQANFMKRLLLFTKQHIGMLKIYRA